MDLGRKYELKFAAIDFDHIIPIVSIRREVDVWIIEETGDGYHLIYIATIIDPLAQAQICERESAECILYHVPEYESSQVELSVSVMARVLS